MRANVITRTIIIIRSIWLTFVCSLKIISLAYTGKYTRARINLLTRTWANKILEVVKASVTISYAHEIRYEANKCYIIMSNHCSHYDIPIIFKALPGSIRMIAKKELFQVPIWGKAMQFAEIISIDRTNHRQAILDLKTAKEKMQSGIIPWIAPEGTRSRTGQLQDFKKGGFMLAIQTEATIIPVNIHGSFEILPPKTSDFTTKQAVRVNIGEPISTAGYTIKDLSKLMEETRNKIAAL